MNSNTFDAINNFLGIIGFIITLLTFILALRIRKKVENATSKAILFSEHVEFFKSLDEFINKLILFGNLRDEERATLFLKIRTTIASEEEHLQAFESSKINDLLTNIHNIIHPPLKLNQNENLAEYLSKLKTIIKKEMNI